MAIFWLFKHILRQSIHELFAILRVIPALARFWRSFSEYQKLAVTGKALQAQPKYLYPRLGDDTTDTPIDPTYFYQDAWAFEKIVQQQPVHHIDVGSHHKYVSLLSKVVPVTMV